MSRLPPPPQGKRLKTMASHHSSSINCNINQKQANSDSSSSFDGENLDYSGSTYASVSGISAASFTSKRSLKWRCSNLSPGSSTSMSQGHSNYLANYIGPSKLVERITDKNLHDNYDGDESEPDNDANYRNTRIHNQHDDVAGGSNETEGEEEDIRADESDYLEYDFYLYESDSEDNIDHSLPHEYLKHDPTPETQYPKPDWITVHELNQRKYGFSSRHTMPTRQNMFWFERYVTNSLWMIQRLELSKRLEEHSGCVNCLSFNELGNLLCSGSDDLLVCIWDWQKKKLKSKIYTGHSGNVFQCRFCNFDRSILTSSRDGSVRLLDVETHQSEELLSQTGEIGKIDFISPHTCITCGTNACVNFIDLRMKEPIKLFTVRSPDTYDTCALHSINVHPLDKYKVVVAGASPYVFLYDLRRIARNPHDFEQKPTHCLDSFEDSNNIVTSTAFNSMGDNLLISYNDDDLMVCRTDTFEIFHRYKGHRNKKTIKGCSWFGDNFVMSGSDDGHIYGWDLESEHIVCFLEGDSKGVVNCLSTHPTLPILASSGHDSNVKIWEPISKTWPQTLKGIKPQICKNTMRRKREKGRRNLVVRGQLDSETDTDL